MCQRRTATNQVCSHSAACKPDPALHHGHSSLAVSVLTRCYGAHGAYFLCQVLLCMSEDMHGIGHCRVASLVRRLLSANVRAHVRSAHFGVQNGLSVKSRQRGVQPFPARSFAPDQCSLEYRISCIFTRLSCGRGIKRGRPHFT